MLQDQEFKIPKKSLWRRRMEVLGQKKWCYGGHHDLLDEDDDGIGHTFCDDCGIEFMLGNENCTNCGKMIIPTPTIFDDGKRKKSTRRYSIRGY